MQRVDVQFPTALQEAIRKTKSVSELLTVLELSKWTTTLHSEDIVHLVDLVGLSEDDLKGVGLTLGARKKLLQAIPFLDFNNASNTLQAAPTTNPADSAPSPSAPASSPSPPLLGTAPDGQQDNLNSTAPALTAVQDAVREALSWCMGEPETLDRLAADPMVAGAMQQLMSAGNVAGQAAGGWTLQRVLESFPAVFRVETGSDGVVHVTQVQNKQGGDSSEQQSGGDGKTEQSALQQRETASIASLSDMELDVSPAAEQQQAPSSNDQPTSIQNTENPATLTNLVSAPTTSPAQPSSTFAPTATSRRERRTNPWDVPPSIGQQQNMHSQTLYVTHLPRSWCNADLVQFFSPFGFIANAHVVRDRESHESKGFGFVSYYSVDAAVAAVQCANGVFVTPDCRLVVQFKRQMNRAEQALQSTGAEKPHVSTPTALGTAQPVQGGHNTLMGVGSA